MLKIRFKIALTAANMTLQAWAKSHGVTYQAVGQVLRGKATSARLSAAIDSFIEQEFKKLPVLATSAKEDAKAA
jgi:hypothetical protein